MFPGSLSQVCAPHKNLKTADGSSNYARRCSPKVRCRTGRSHSYAAAGWRLGDRLLPFSDRAPWNGGDEGRRESLPGAKPQRQNPKKEPDRSTTVRPGGNSRISARGDSGVATGLRVFGGRPQTLSIRESTNVMRARCYPHVTADVRFVAIAVPRCRTGRR